MRKVFSLSFALAVFMLLTGLTLSRSGSRTQTGTGTKRHVDNPQDFFLWTSTTSLSHSFRYDPRAADEWQFHSGARFFMVTLTKDTNVTRGANATLLKRVDGEP